MNQRGRGTAEGKFRKQIYTSTRCNILADNVIKFEVGNIARRKESSSEGMVKRKRSRSSAAAWRRIQFTLEILTELEITNLNHHRTGQEIV